MKTDLFISYAWTSDAHRNWVRLLASHLHLMGYTVKIDENVDYGTSLNGFMRDVIDTSHVLLIVDENYVNRANTKPESGVGIETKWVSEAFNSKPKSWLSVIFVGNPERKLPDWLNGYNPKGFDFNSAPNKNEFAGSIQLDSVWRWIEGLPADKSNATPLSVLCKRTARLERVDLLRDSAHYSNPSLHGSVTFRYREHSFYKVGNGEYEFKIKFSGCDQDSVHVYTDGGLKAVGLITVPDFDLDTVDSFLTPGRTISPKVGQKAILLNDNGVLCIITINEVQREVNTRDYIPEHVTFSYEILKNY
ncbi:toll/interleukin-1 receptor domain-containing protein [Proteus mirabilis]|nr:toll/interleukin-1 receptor domain-containing protein [Proteus mirabilis]